MDITTMSVTELKALAFDQTVEMQRIQANIQTIVAQINKLQQPTKAVEAVEKEETENKSEETI